METSFQNQQNKNIQTIKETFFLSEQQAKGLSINSIKDLDPSILNPQSRNLYQEIEPENDFDYSNPQTVDQFIRQVQNFRTNTAEQKYITLAKVKGSGKQSFSINMQKVTELFQAFYPGLIIRIKELPIILQKTKKTQKNTKKFDICVYNTETKQEKQTLRQKSPNSQTIEAKQLQNVFLPYKSKDDYSFIIYLEQGLFMDGYNHEMAGYAIGNRMAVINSRMSQSERTILTIGVHECLHTMGFPHCRYFDCLMNAGYTAWESQFHLCPMDIMKLQYLLKFDVNSRYKKIKEWCDKYNFENESLFIEQLLNTNQDCITIQEIKRESEKENENEIESYLQDKPYKKLKKEEKQAPSEQTSDDIDCIVISD